jgi:Protein of unknown function (DUF2987)
MRLAILISIALRLWAPYHTLLENLHLARFVELPESERSRITPLVRLAPAGGPPRAITLVIRAKGGDIALEAERDGAVMLPLRQALLAEDPPVLTSLPEGMKTNITLDLRPSLPNGLTFTYADLFAAVGQANRYIRGEAGFFKFMAPKMKGLVLHFKGGLRWVQVDDKILRSDNEGSIKLQLDEDLLKKDPQVTLEERPLSVDFFD